MKLPRSSFGRTSVSGSEEQRSNRCGAAILPQYPTKEVDRSVKPASFDSLGALPRCGTSYSMDSSHRCESPRYLARVSELAYERHSECRAHMGLRVRIAPRAPPIPFRIDRAIYRPMRSSMQCVFVSKYALEPMCQNRKLSQLPTARITCIIDKTAIDTVTTICPSGGTGRRNGFKIRRRKACGFESRLGYHID